jgi:hypothetical protein
MTGAPTASCRTCGSTARQIVPRTFRDGTHHSAEQCAQCGRHFRFVPRQHRLPEETSSASAGGEIVLILRPLPCDIPVLSRVRQLLKTALSRDWLECTRIVGLPDSWSEMPSGKHQPSQAASDDAKPTAEPSAGCQNQSDSVS